MFNKKKIIELEYKVECIQADYKDLYTKYWKERAKIDAICKHLNLIIQEEPAKGAQFKVTSAAQMATNLSGSSH